MSLPDPTPDSTVLVTGASAEIGTELGRQLAGRGYNVVLVARRAERLQELAEELRARHGVTAEPRACDLGDHAARQALVDELLAGDHHVAGVCNNAGFSTLGRFQDLEVDKELDETELNVVALQHLTGAFLPGMLARGTGAILNVGSIAGFQPLPRQATYSATKAFVNAFSEAVHTDLAGTGVSCTVLCPGPVKTEFAEVAGFGELGESGPDFVWESAADVARAGLEGMVKGRRTVIPGLSARVAGLSGRYSPRTVLLPLYARLAGGPIDRQSA
jgi:uncharacterized protein